MEEAVFSNHALFTGEQTVYPCEICHKTFDKYKNLFRHVKTHKVGVYKQILQA